MPSDRRRLGFIAAILASTFLMGSSFVAAKVLIEAGFEPLPLAGWRFGLAALGMLLFILPAWVTDPGPRRLPNRRTLLCVALLGVLQTAGVMSLLFLAMQFIPAGTAAILLFTNPLWVALFGYVFLGERLRVWEGAGLALGVAGVALAIGVELSPGSDLLWGEMLALGAAFCWAAATILNKWARLPFRPTVLCFWQMLVGAVCILLVATPAGQYWPREVSCTQWGWFIWLALPASAGSFGLWFVALARGGATQSSAFLFLTPVFAVILSALLLKTPLTLFQGLGGALIGAAILLINAGRFPPE